jgi:hypothetical protein
MPTSQRSAAVRALLRLLPPERLVFRPEALQLAILKSALPGGAALELPQDLQDIPKRTRSLLALLPQRQGDPPWLAGVRATTLHRSQRVLTHAGPALKALARAGIPVLALKGLAMVLAVYRDLQSRAMADLDLLVPPERIHQAVTVLQPLGWSLRDPHPAGFDRSPGHVDHSVTLRHPERVEIDLHYYSLDENRVPGDDDRLWERSRPQQLLGAECRVPCPEDLLLGVCAHGYRMQRGVPRWVADARLLLQTPVDWDLVLEETRRRRMVLPLLTTLGYLSRNLQAPVPARVLQALEAEPLALWEPLDFAVRAATPLDGRLRRVFLALVDYLRYERGRPTPWAFYRYLLTRWNARGALDLAGIVMERARAALQGRRY